MAIRWKNSFSCNIKEIDEQHKKLFEISSKLNILEPLCTKIDFKEEILEVIINLKAYVDYHFSYEEKLMLQYDYADFDAHVLEHEKFKQVVLEYEKKTDLFHQEGFASEMLFYINQWIIEHIYQVDMQYQIYINSKGVE